MSSYDDKKAEYAITDEEHEMFRKLERKQGFSVLAFLVDSFTDEHKCSFPWLDGDAVEEILDEYVELLRGGDFYSGTFETMHDALWKVSGVRLD